MSEEFTSEFTSIVRAVVIAPHDAAPRLILADWLEERGHVEWAADLRKPGLGPSCAHMLQMLFSERIGLYRRGPVEPVRYLSGTVGIREVLSGIDSARAFRLSGTSLAKFRRMARAGACNPPA